MSLFWNGLKAFIQQKILQLDHLLEERKRKKEYENAIISIERIYIWDGDNMSNAPKVYKNDKILSAKFSLRTRQIVHFENLEYDNPFIEIHYKMFQQEFSAIYKEKTITFPPIDPNIQPSDVNMTTKDSITTSYYCRFLEIDISDDIQIEETDITEYMKVYEGIFHPFHISKFNQNSANIDEIMKIFHLICSVNPESPLEALEIHFGKNKKYSNTEEYIKNNQNLQKIHLSGFLKVNFLFNEEPISYT